MAIVTSQIISRYYEEFKNTEITFTKDIMRTLAMDPRQIYIKCSGSQWPCIVNSSSFSQVRIIVGTKGGAFQIIAKKDAPPVSIRFAFYQPDGQLLSLFISGKVVNIASYMNSKEMAIVTINYTQKPPDDFIEMIGHLIDANTNAIRRKEDRIVITPDSLKKLGIPRKETVIIIQNVPRHCILQDISFGGAKVVLMGLAQFLVNKEVEMRLEFDEPHEVIALKGVIMNTMNVEGRKDIISANIKFDDASITLPYKIHINNYITTARKGELNTTFAGDTPVQPVTPPQPKPAAPSPQTQQAAPKPAAQPASAQAPAAQAATQAAPNVQAPSAGTTPAQNAEQPASPAPAQ